MRDNDDLRPLGNEVLDCRHGRPYTGVVADRPVLPVERDVEIYPDQYSLAGDVDIANRHLIHAAQYISSYFASYFRVLCSSVARDDKLCEIQ